MNSVSGKPNQHLSRTGKGLFQRNLKGAARDAECARMRAAGYLLREIGEHVGLTEGNVSRAIERALRDVQSPAVEALRASQQSVLDTMKSTLLDIMAREHVAHSNGKIIERYDDVTGDVVPVLDDGPKIQAINALRQALEREAKLHGADSPIRTVVEGDELVIRIKGVDTDLV